MREGSAAALLLLGGALLLLGVASEADAATAAVSIAGSRFSPQTIDVTVGDTVRFTNMDGTAHTATATGSWDTGTIAPNGGESSLTMAQAGTFSYVCKFHTSMTGTVRVAAGAVENVAPSVSISSPPGGATMQAIAVVSGVATDANNDPVAVGVRVDNGAWQPASLSGSTWTFGWDTRSLTNGPHTITARANDGKVTSISATLTYKVYNPPTIAIVSPAALAINATIGSAVTFTGTATAAPSSTLTIEVSVDGGEWRLANGRNAWSYSWNTTNETTGAHVVQARAGDGASFALSPTRNVTLEEAPQAPPDEPPALVIHAPAEGAAVAGLVNITGNATDEDGPLPIVEVNVLGSGWRNVSGRAGAIWWYHWIPQGAAPGVVEIEVRASDAHATTSLVRRAMLVADPPALAIAAMNTSREGHDVVVHVTTVAPGLAPLPGARVLLLAADGSLLHERTANASGLARFPPLRAGNYTVRAYAPGFAGGIELPVGTRYQVGVFPSEFHFGDNVLLTVHVASGSAVPGATVQLRGDPLPGGVSETFTTGREGNASFVPQPLSAGELAVWVAGNDTGLRVRVIPTLVAEWSPDPPVPAQDIRIRFSLNDRARSPAVGARVLVDLPGDPQRELVTDARGEIVVRAVTPGAARIDASMDGLRSTTHRFMVRTPPGAAELRDLAIRPGPGVIDVGALARNVGNGTSGFLVDAVATSSTGAALQRTFTTRSLAPGEEELAQFRLPVGPGDYRVALTVRNSMASVNGTARVTDDGLPPRIEPVLDLSEPTPEEEGKKVPGLGAFALVAIVAALARLRRR